MAQVERCPICRGPVEPRRVNDSYPFCSERCRLLDLGRWLEGSYRVPEQFVEEEVVELPTEEDEES